MKSETIKLRVPTDDLERWKALGGENLSDWIRAQCNRACNPPAVEGQAESPAPYVPKATLPKVSKFDDIDETVARRSGHELGCNCLGCYQQGAFMRKSRAESAK